ncbi:MAG TPA: PIN domain-containing protein [Thermoanaerobaculia bacterium]|nr:PIN domain-containing protein [Thermoanaerobaculia bacterium]
MTERVFVDTNVLVYLFDKASPAKQLRSQELLSSHGSQHELVLSTQVLQEFLSVATRKLVPPLEPAEALAVVEDLTRLPVVVLETAILISAMRRTVADSLSFWDALIVEAALSANCQRMGSEDFQAGRRFGSLWVETPFLNP